MHGALFFQKPRRKLCCCSPLIPFGSLAISTVCTSHELQMDFITQARTSNTSAKSTSSKMAPAVARACGSSIVSFTFCNFLCYNWLIALLSESINLVVCHHCVSKIGRPCEEFWTCGQSTDRCTSTECGTRGPTAMQIGSQMLSLGTWHNFVTSLTFPSGLLCSLEDRLDNLASTGGCLHWHEILHNRIDRACGTTV